MSKPEVKIVARVEVPTERRELELRSRAPTQPAGYSVPDLKYPKRAEKMERSRVRVLALALKAEWEHRERRELVDAMRFARELQSEQLLQHLRRAIVARLYLEACEALISTMQHMSYDRDVADSYLSIPHNWVEEDEDVKRYVDSRLAGLVVLVSELHWSKAKAPSNIGRSTYASLDEAVEAVLEAQLPATASMRDIKGQLAKRWLEEEKESPLLTYSCGVGIELGPFRDFLAKLGAIGADSIIADKGSVLADSGAIMRKSSLPPIEFTDARRLRFADKCSHRYSTQDRKMFVCEDCGHGTSEMPAQFFDHSKDAGASVNLVEEQNGGRVVKVGEVIVGYAASDVERGHAVVVSVGKGGSGAGGVFTFSDPLVGQIVTGTPKVET